MADAAHFNRQLLRLQNRVAQQSAQRDFGRGDQTQIGPLDAVNLRFRSARNEADPAQNLVPRQIRRNRRRKALANQLVDRVLLQRQLHQHRVVFEKVKSMPGNFRTPFEIHHLQVFADRHMIARRES